MSLEGNEFKTGAIAKINLDLAIEEEVITELPQIVIVYYYVLNKKRIPFSWWAKDLTEPNLAAEALAADPPIIVNQIIFVDEIIRTYIPVNETDNVKLNTCDHVDVFAEIIYVDSSGVASQGTLTMDTQPTDGDFITVGGVTYTFRTTLAAANDIQIGVDLTATQASLVAVFQLSGIEGTDYGVGTLAHPTVNAQAFVSNDMLLTAKIAGVAGDLIDTTSTFVAGTNLFNAPTLGTTTAGVDGDKFKYHDINNCDLCIGHMIKSITEGWL